MAHHAKHARTPEAKNRTRLPLIGLAAASLGVVAAPAARADAAAASTAPVSAATAQQAGLDEIGGVQLYPLAGTPLDLLSNNLRVPVGGMEFTTFPVTAPLHNGLPLRDVPLVGTLLP